ncbi:MAG: hypothetical protein JXK05_07355 [Campylobacterales bacterium]|nr:hypothetical protein [Campylobacterales bacterium]
MRLENSIWHRYHPQTSLHEGLVRFYGCESESVSTDDDYLYALLKRKLTKKELRFLIMDEAKVDTFVIADTLHVSVEECEALRRKAYRKLRDGKMRKLVTSQPESQDNEESEGY